MPVVHHQSLFFGFDFPRPLLTMEPRYINDFSKALASEVRILLDEVGKLRDERRALQ